MYVSCGWKVQNYYMLRTVHVYFKEYTIPGEYVVRLGLRLCGFLCPPLFSKL